MAWGDVDNDGDLDLAAGNYRYDKSRVYTNGWLNRPGGLPETPTSVVLARRPGTAAAAFGYSSAEILVSPVEIPFSLFDEQSDMAWRIVPEFSINGGGRWMPAATTGSPTTALAASPGGTEHVFSWDLAADESTRSDNVVFRIGVQWQAPNAVGGELQRAAMTATSLPFRATSVPGLLFRDNFESGDTSAWYAVP